MESKDMHHANAFTAELAEARGDAYAAVIRKAGNLHRTLDVVTAPGFDRMYLGHAEGRYRGLLQLDGMKSAAVAIVTATSNIKHNVAEGDARTHIAGMAACITRDVDASTATLANPSAAVVAGTWNANRTD